jgi:branched-chain amino acid transport system permease protein
MDQLTPAITFILLYGVSFGIVLFVISIGLVLTLGLMRIVNLAHGVFAVLGGYLAFKLPTLLGISFLASAVLAVLLVLLIGVLLERVFFRWLFGMSELEQVLATIGFCFAFIALLTFAFGPNVLATKYPEWLSGNISVLGRPFPVYRVFVMVVGLVILLGLWLLFDHTSFGATLRACVDNQSMAKATGINVNWYFSVAFAIGAGLAAIGGIVGAGMLPLEPLYPFKHLPLFLTIVALSGFGNIKASLVVSLVVGLVDTAGRYFVPELGAFTVFTLLVILVLWRPQGLLVGLK